MAQTPPDRDDYLGEADPYQVTLYEDPAYKNPIGSWRLESGRRMLKIPQISRVPRSIFLGSKVGAYLFPAYNYSSAAHGHSQKLVTHIGSFASKWYLRPYFDYLGSNPLITDLPGDKFSLVIHRKDIPDILGVYLFSGDPASKSSTGQFYPLPEQGQSNAIVYNKLPHSDPRRLGLLAGGNHRLRWSAKGNVHPNAHDIDIAIEFTNGSSMNITGENTTPPPASWNLTKGMLSSLRLRYIGPFDKHHYVHVIPKGHRAPSASSQQLVTVKPGATHKPYTLQADSPRPRVEDPAPREPQSPVPSPGPLAQAPVGEEGIGAIITGNTLDIELAGTHANWSIYFRPDGTVFARSGRGDTDIGRWSTDGEQYCTQYQRLRGGRQACFWVTPDGQQFGVHNAQDGRLVGIARIMQGNPERLGHGTGYQ